MKIQNMAIILVIILIPIIISLSAYTKAQIDTIAIQTQYKTKLRDATYDAVTAFQLNTEENSYSTISDSMRRDIKAAIQTFISNFAKNIGMSAATEERIKPYIPAVVFTLYDGYYIYSPAISYSDLINSKSLSDSNYQSTGDVERKTGEDKKEYYISQNQPQIPTDDVIEKLKQGRNENSGTYEHVLKPYIYYTVRYAPKDNENYDFIVNYSLDNYVVIYGLVDGEYVTRAGYLVASNRDVNISEILHKKLPVTRVIFKDDQYNKSKINNMSDYGIGMSNLEVTNDYMSLTRIKNGGPISDIKEINLNGDEYILGNPYLVGNSQYIDTSTGKTKRTMQASGKVFNPPFEDPDRWGWYVSPKTDDYYVDPNSASKFYSDAVKFTEWVNENLSEIKASDAVKVNRNSSENKNETVSYTKKTVDGHEYNIFGDDLIFKIDGNNDPENDESAFNEHKREVIKLSIEDNLSQAIASYNKRSQAFDVTYNFKLPNLTEPEWDQVLKNVCMITFVQGLKGGTKIFNDYTIVTSTKNKEYISPASIYYVNEDSNGNPAGDTSSPGYGKYHKLGCKYLENQNIIGYLNTEFDRSSYEEQVFDKDETGAIKTDKNGNGVTTDKKYYYNMHEYGPCYYCMVSSTDESDEVNVSENSERLKAYYTALARERYNFYKTNKYLNDEIKTGEIKTNE